MDLNEKEEITNTLNPFGIHKQCKYELECQPKVNIDDCKPAERGEEEEMSKGSYQIHQY